MRLEFRKQVHSDIARIMEYYEDVAGPHLADEKAAQTPESYPVRKRDLRRVNLTRFPYHFFFRIVEDCVRILVVRHHKRRPKLTLGRR